MEQELVWEHLGIENPGKSIIDILKDKPDCKIAVESNDVMYSNFQTEEIWPGMEYSKTFDFQ